MLLNVQTFLCWKSVRTAGIEECRYLYYTLLEQGSLLWSVRALGAQAVYVHAFPWGYACNEHWERLLLIAARPGPTEDYIYSKSDR